MTSSTPITISSLKYIAPTDLADVLLNKDEASKTAIIDVRDSDHIGGHIKGSQWVPVNQLDARIPELLRTLKNKDKVVFHCMLSQQRGPSAALKYARAKQAQKKDAAENKQEICVLSGGFGTWQARYGSDARLTEGYVPDLWDE